MDRQKNLTRREALKKMGALAAGVGLGIGGANAAELFGASPDKYKARTMKVLLVNGSPHEEGCTYTALAEIADTLKKNDVDSDFFWIGKEPIAGCIACGACSGSGKCFREDTVNAFIDRMDDYDGFVFGAPVHFASTAGAMVAFMDRVFYLGAIQKSRFAGKPGAAITCCRRAGTTATLDQMSKYITGNNMPMVPSLYWNMVHGLTPDEVRQDKEGLQIMRTLAQNMAWMLKCFDAGKQAGVETPLYEKPVFTNFVR